MLACISVMRSRELILPGRMVAAYLRACIPNCLEKVIGGLGTGEASLALYLPSCVRVHLLNTVLGMVSWSSGFSIEGTGDQIKVDDHRLHVSTQKMPSRSSRRVSGFHSSKNSSVSNAGSRAA
jgi:hypothetical protein